VVQLEIRKNAYYDSVTLMLISKELKKVAGVTEALVGMGTDLNVEIAHNIGVATPEFDKQVTANDFFVAVECRDEASFAAAMKKVEELLNKKTEAKASSYSPPTLEGALIEPLAVGFHAAFQGGAQAGQTAVVLGAGCIGLVSMMALKACGVSRVIVADIVQKRLEKALELGADFVVNAAQADTVEEIIKYTSGRGADLTIETAGTETTATQAIHLSRKGAVVVLVGYGKSGMMNLPVSLAIDKELTFKTVFRYRHVYPVAIEAVAAGKVNLKGIVTNLFRFDDIQNAMDASAHNKSEIVKSAVRIASV